MAGIFTHCTFMVIVALILTAEVKAQFFTVPIGQKSKQVQVEQQIPAIYSTSISANDYSQDSLKTTANNPQCADSGKRRPNVRARISLPLRRIRVTSPYGMRRHPIYKDFRFHNGIDLAAHYEPVYAMLDGIVIEAGSNPSAGKYVTLQHGTDLEVTYMHLSRIHVTKDDRVRSGELVAHSGNTGVSSSPHLHIKATYCHRSLNPIHILRLFKHR